MEKVKSLLSRLWSACSRKPDYGDGLWAQGVEKIEEKYGVKIWLKIFEPEQLKAEESSTAKVTISEQKKSICPLCPKLHNSEEYDVGWHFLCSVGCHVLVWVNTENGLELQVAPNQFEE